MRIPEIIVCDVCGRRVLQVGQTERFVVRRDGVLHAWDVGPCCIDTRFRIHAPRQVDVVVTVRP